MAAPPTTAARPGTAVIIGAAAFEAELEAAAAEVAALEASEEAELNTALEAEARAEEAAAGLVEATELIDDAWEARAEEAALEMEA